MRDISLNRYCIPKDVNTKDMKRPTARMDLLGWTVWRHL